MILKADTTLCRCYKCAYWSERVMSITKYKKSFRFLRPKYWKFMLIRMNMWRYGYCHISPVEDAMDRFIVTRGTDRCVYGRDIEPYLMSGKQIVEKDEQSSKQN